MIWGCLWRSENRLDGNKRHIIYEKGFPVMFHTRHEAREYINNKYGYIRDREDLKDEPHGWMMPIPVKLTIKDV